MKPLDFLVIGAQKCATTTLFEHLRAHDDIVMPLEKEVPFFSGDACCVDRWGTFASRYFGDETDKLWGKASPQYLSDPHAAQRIHALMPGVKLVAILRDPIDRTWSHYQMGVRRETEPRDFDTAVAELLSPQSLRAGRAGSPPAHAQGYEPEGDYYVTWSEYGRMLRRYIELFGQEQVCVVFTEELRRDPGATLDRVLAFMGLEPGYRPAGLDRVVHQGGGSNRIPTSVRRWLRERGALYALWNLLPDERRGRLRFLYEQWNVRKSAPPAQRMTPATERALRDHFAPDLAELAGLTGAAPPWLDRYAV